LGEEEITALLSCFAVATGQIKVTFARVGLAVRFLGCLVCSRLPVGFLSVMGLA
jgi:hypothetical protein